MRTLVLLPLLSLAIFSQSGAAARLGTQAIFPDGSNDQLPQNQQNARLFPLLTWLRDGAVELIFGRPPRKTDSSASQLHESFLTKYAGDVVLRFNLTTFEEEAALSEAVSRLFLDVWAFTDDYVDVRIRKKTITSFLGLLPMPLRKSYSTLIPDLAALIRDTYPSRSTSQSHLRQLQDGTTSLRIPPGDGDNLFFQDYQSLPVITQWMRLLAAMFPSIAHMTSIGISYEGRDIPALRVGVDNPTKAGNSRKTVVVTGGMHAREWISTSTVNYLAWSFITSYGKEPMITKFMDHFDLVFIPVVNPDGVEYTWQVDRLWRKSRQETPMRFCRGLDLDHAFGYEWSDKDAQTDPCSESYGGDGPFQAVEALQLAKWARNETEHNVDFVGLIDLHSYSQQVLFPFSYSCSVDPPNLENLQELAVGLAKAIRLSNGEMYSVASACEGAVYSKSSKGDEVLPRIESGGGSAIDWFYHELHARYSYQIKLRDTGSYGFLLPKENIIPTGEEIFSAMKYFGDYLLGNNGIEKSIGEDPKASSSEDFGHADELRRVRRKR